MLESTHRTTKHIRTHLSHPCKNHLYSMLTYAKFKKKKKRSEKQVASLVHNRIVFPPQAMSLHRCFIQPLQHLATLKVLQPLHSLPLYCEEERERGNDRDRLFTTTPFFLPVLARGRQRGGGWGTLGRQHNCEGSSLELRAAQRVIEWSSTSGPPES